ncbi:hypothetical protein HQ590_03900 [bacterium]|nr:hypothetical protein [bacterium]
MFDQKVFFAVKAPADLPFVLTGGFACPNLSSRLYFYVPPGLRKLAFHSTSVVPVDLRDSDGNPVAHDGGKVCAVDVPAGQDGKVWSVAKMKSYRPWRLLNAPNAFAFAAVGNHGAGGSGGAVEPRGTGILPVQVPALRPIDWTGGTPVPRRRNLVLPSAFDERRLGRQCVGG